MVRITEHGFRRLGVLFEQAVHAGFKIRAVQVAGFCQLIHKVDRLGNSGERDHEILPFIQVTTSR